MANESAPVNALRTWIFPSVMSLVSLLIWSMINDIKSDIADVKADIKVLMAQSNVDKTRIDNIERQLYKPSTTNLPAAPAKDEAPKANHYAILTKNKLSNHDF